MGSGGNEIGKVISQFLVPVYNLIQVLTMYGLRSIINFF